MGKLFLGKGCKLYLFCFDFKIIQHVKIFKQKFRIWKILKTAQNNAEKKNLRRVCMKLKRLFLIWFLYTSVRLLLQLNFTKPLELRRFDSKVCSGKWKTHLHTKQSNFTMLFYHIKNAINLLPYHPFNPGTVWMSILFGVWCWSQRKH